MDARRPVHGVAGGGGAHGLCQVPGTCLPEPEEIRQFFAELPVNAPWCGVPVLGP